MTEQSDSVSMIPGSDTGVKLQSEPLLQVNDLSVEFVGLEHTVRAVDGMNLRVRHGEVVALVGESGSGKSMTAKSIAGLLPSQAKVVSGEVLFDGIDLLSLSDRQMNNVRGSRIGMLFQNPKARLDPTSRIGDQVGEALRVHQGVSSRAAWQRSVELLADVGIPEPERRARGYAHQLSGGMAQRVMIAAALAGEPDLLIADEPTTALDVTIQAQVLRLLLNLKEERGLSMLFITHDLGLVPVVADQVVVMYAGHPVETGPASDIISEPRHPYTEALLRSSMLIPEADGLLYAIPGGPPQPGQTIGGCPFRPRCQYADSLGLADRCEVHDPPMADCDGDEHHRACCWGLELDLLPAEHQSRHVEN